MIAAFRKSLSEAGYTGWQQHGFRALKEFCATHNRTYRYEAFAPGQFSVAIVFE